MISADTPDYRASRSLEFAVHRLPVDLEQQLITATTKMGLSFAGWDFKLDKDGSYWCLEANPMPGYDGYDRRLNGRITESLLEVFASTREATDFTAA
jgi:glutathione synthase/RimK-type ligase-like ATP-grasp enzyme